MILVDVGVWLAAIWGRHAHHRVARQWFDAQPGDLILCRVTQMSLRRLITNPAITLDTKPKDRYPSVEVAQLT